MVGAYLADFIDEGAGPKPVHFREAFRTIGPGNYFHGKQAEAKMYQYNGFDTTFLKQRNLQFRDQVQLRMSGALSEEEFKPLRLLNELYLQLHAYLLRVTISYGTVNSAQMTALASIAEE